MIFTTKSGRMDRGAWVDRFAWFPRKVDDESARWFWLERFHERIVERRWLGRGAVFEITRVTRSGEHGLVKIYRPE